MQILNNPPSKSKYFKFKKGSGSSATTSLTVTGLGFKPKFVFYYSNDDNTSSTRYANIGIISDLIDMSVNNGGVWADKVSLYALQQNNTLTSGNAILSNNASAISEVDGFTIFVNQNVLTDWVALG